MIRLLTRSSLALAVLSLTAGIGHAAQESTDGGLIPPMNPSTLVVFGIAAGLVMYRMARPPEQEPKE